MMILITYDVETTSPQGKKRLNKVAKHCVNYGQRVQNSVFECNLDQTQFTIFRRQLESLIDVEKDSIRYYFLGNNWITKVEHIGAKKTYNPEDVLIV